MLWKKLYNEAISPDVAFYITLFLQEFLQKLDRPLTVSDEKIARWHPRFRLDQVPDIEAAELPKPPQVKKLTTAREVLEEAKADMNPRVRNV